MKKSEMLQRILAKVSEVCEVSPDAVKRKAKVVDKLFRGYSCRCLQSYAFCLMSAEISAWCREQYDALYCAGMKPAPHK